MWSSAYPFGAYGVVASQFAIDFDSIAFRVITTIILFVLIIYWLYAIICTLPMVVSGELFLGDLVKEREKEEKDRGGEDEEREGGERGEYSRGIGNEERKRSSDKSRRHRRSDETAV